MLAKKPATIARAITKDAPNPEALAQAVIDIAVGMRALKNSRLSRRAILVLIKDECKNVALNDIGRIIDAAANLDKTFLKDA